LNNINANENHYQIEVEHIVFVDDEMTFLRT
jgi:hypothetical protein